MVTFNLLPWRKAAHVYQKKVMLKFSLIAVLLTSFICFFLHAWILRKESLSQLRLNRLQQSLERALPISQSNDDKIQHLSSIILSNHSFTKNMITTFNQSPENEVCLTEVTRVKNIFSFTGEARSAVDLMNFLHAWPAATLFSEIKIMKLEKNDHARMTFHFQAILYKRAFA